MGADKRRERIFFAGFHNKFNCVGNFIARHNNVVRKGYEADEAYAFLAVAAHFPDAFVCFQHFYRACFGAQLVKAFHLHIQFVFVVGFNGNDNINAILIMRHIFIFAVICGSAYIGIIHVFNAGRVNACL